MKSFLRTTTLLAVLLMPVATLAVTIVGGVDNSGGSFLGISWGNGGGGRGGGGGCASAVCDVANTILYLINGVAVPVLFAVAFIVFLYGIAQAYIFSKGDAAKVSQGHQLVLWGIIAFAVMVSVWGLVNVVATTFGLDGFYAPPLPTSF